VENSTALEGTGVVAFWSILGRILGIAGQIMLRIRATESAFDRVGNDQFTTFRAANVAVMAAVAVLLLPND
jgi:hypothetical protein